MSTSFVPVNLRISDVENQRPKQLYCYFQNTSDNILYRIAFPPARKPYRVGLLFAHKNGDFGEISVTERSCAALIQLSLS